MTTESEYTPTESRSEQALISAFENLLARKATDKEKLHLLRVKNALGLRENDAMWLILMSLEEYVYRFDQVSGKLREDTHALVEEHKGILDAEAVSAAQKAQEKIADALAKRVESTISQATQTKYMVSLAWSVIALVLLAVVTFAAGVVMGSGKIPWWTRPAIELTLPQIFLSSVLSAPAGWIFSLLAVPCSVYYLYNFSLEGLTKKRQIEKILKSVGCVLVTFLFLYWAFIF
jgi:hypothetical protein